ncbi:MAG TPA: XRE family transcriptional regulator [Terriglobales bacterium]|nr:XRE family transcriptional regulator [Terriglobales bacterium]
MGGRKKLAEWASRIIALRRRFRISQAALAKRLDCSAMTVSRWERGLQVPTADYYIQLGKLAGKNECWFFWERAGLPIADVARALRRPPLDRADTGTAAKAPAVQRMVVLPLLNAVAGTQGVPGTKRLSLDHIPATRRLGVPSEWCPNPGFTRLLRVHGRSMAPLIRDGDIIAVDSFQNERSELDGKIVIVAHEEKRLSVSRLRRYENVNVLEAENPKSEAIVLGKDSGWRIVGKVLWWISQAP